MCSSELGIEYGHGVGQTVAGHVVVADYEVDAETAGIVDLVYGLDAAVKYYHKAYALRGCVVDATLRNPVASVVACRDVVFNVGIEVAQIAVDERHGGGAVHVVVAVDHYPLFRPMALLSRVRLCPCPA